MPVTQNPPHIVNLQDNIAQLTRLLEIHTQVAGPDPGYKYGVEILNKSALVLLVACWEAFIEDLASEAFAVLLSSVSDPAAVPTKVLALAAGPLKNSEDERAVWGLAGEGWKRVLLQHHDDIIDRFIGRLNTPRPGQVDAIFEALLGLRNLSSSWKWRGMSNERVRRKLDNLVDLRGEISHRVSASEPVYKSAVTDHIDFVKRLAAKTHNQVTAHVSKLTGQTPWPAYKYQDIA